ncbi:MAG: hypothetical protein F6K39_27255 [Okeania sp. SIO3B3]|nr:hypothetical protein [Okeania sp. SIO3B3]
MSRIIKSNKLRIGKQHPWTETIKRYLDSAHGICSGVNPNSSIIIEPQLWAVHSVAHDWGKIHYLSLTRRDGTNLTIQFLCVPGLGSYDLSREILPKVRGKIKRKIVKDSEKKFGKVQEILCCYPKMSDDSAHMILDLILPIAIAWG